MRDGREERVGETTRDTIEKRANLVSLQPAFGDLQYSTPLCRVSEEAKKTMIDKRGIKRE